jgi:hypothetical protein
MSMILHHLIKHAHWISQDAYLQWQIRYGYVSNFIFNIPLCDYRLNAVTSDVRHNTYEIYITFNIMINIDSYIVFNHHFIYVIVSSSKTTDIAQNI